MGSIADRIHCWEYRVVSRKDGGYPTFGIYEVYLDEDGNALMHGQEPAQITAESAIDLSDSIRMVQEAMGKPVVSYIHAIPKAVASNGIKIPIQEGKGLLCHNSMVSVVNNREE